MSGPTDPPLGELLKHYRRRNGMRQEALAAASGVSVRTISDLERGQRASAHLETVRLLANALALTGDERARLFAATGPAHTDDERAPRMAAAVLPWTTVIPTPFPPLVGRATELESLGILVSDSAGQIVTLTGPGGVGKTRLALELGHRLAPRYADGVAFVDLAPVTDPARVPDAISRALGATPQPGSGIAQSTALLAAREFLLILDNLEQVVESAPYLAQLALACPRLTILATSRVRLRAPCERIVPVPPLSLAEPDAPVDLLRASDANQLFAERARRVDPAFALTEQNLPTVTAICRLLDGLPLAIELAAQHMRLLSTPLLLERLDHRLPLLTGGNRDHAQRHQSMRATIAWSYELLDPAAQRLLRWMSVFPGGLSLPSAEALATAQGLDPITALQTIAQLVDHGLAARAGEGRLRLLETIREFASEQLAESGETETARHFHAMHYLDLASREAPSPYQPIPNAWIATLAADHANLIQAFDHLCSSETVEESLRFAASMAPYWHTRGPFSEWQPRLQRTLDLTSPEPSIPKLHVLHWMCLILGTSPDHASALETGRQCIEMSIQIGDISDRATALQMMGWIHECHRQWETAQALREEAIILWESVGNRYMLGICRTMNSATEYARGALDRAQPLAVQAATIFQELGIPNWYAVTACYQGMFAVAAGRLDLAAAHYDQALHLSTQSESAAHWYRPLVGLADVAAALGQFATAARLLGAADAMLIVGGRDLMHFDQPIYTRAEAGARAALSPAEFDALHREGRLLPPAAWLQESHALLAATQSPTTTPSR